MMHILTKKEEKKQLKELIEFCKENYVLMYKFMLTIKNIRAEPEKELLMKKLKEQADACKKMKG